MRVKIPIFSSLSLSLGHESFSAKQFQKTHHVEAPSGMAVLAWETILIDRHYFEEIKGRSDLPIKDL